MDILTNLVQAFSFLSLIDTVSTKESRIKWAVFLSVTSKGIVVEFPIPLIGLGFSEITGEFSMPFAKFQIKSPWLLRCFSKNLGSAVAKSLIVKIPNL